VGHEFKKSRPGVVVTSDDHISQTNLITLMPITSNVENPLDEDIIVKKSKANNLFCDSLIKVQHIYSFD